MATYERRRPPLTAGDVMTESPRTCSPFSTVTEAVMIFRDAGCGAVPVVDAGTPVGVLTDRDVALALADHPDLAGMAVGDVMSKGAYSVGLDTPLSEVKAQFGVHGVHRLLVADAAGQLIGIVTLTDVVPHLSDSELGEFVTDSTRRP